MSLLRALVPGNTVLSISEQCNPNHHDNVGSLVVNGEDLRKVKIKQDTFPKMSLSPLPFVSAMILLAGILNKIIICIESKKKKSLKINQLPYLNDLKLYNKPNAKSESLLDIVLVFSEDVTVKSAWRNVLVRQLKEAKL